MALEYMDGRTAAVVSAEIRIETRESGEMVVILAESDRAEIAAWPLAEIDYEDSQTGKNAVVHLLSRTFPGAMVSGNRDEFPPGLEEKLRRGPVGGFLRGFHATMFVPLLAFIIALGFGVYSALPMISGSLAKKVPLEWEAKISEVFLDGLVDRKSVLKGPADDALQKILARLARGIPGEPVYLFRPLLVSDMTVNAFAIPGGLMLMNCGLVDAAESPEEVAGVLAHEMQHTISRHVLAGIIRALGLSAMWNMAVGDFSGVLVIDPETFLTIASLKFSRMAETEADLGALTLLQAAGISPLGMRTFFERMEKREKEMGGAAQAALSMISTHPESAVRARLFVGLPEAASEPPVLDVTEWAALKSACAKR